ncbi:MAG: ribonuclease III, partial [Lachnospiraceae bacterium]|nr:ribonuclease III [Lachnospiraceae bacterium]
SKYKQPLVYKVVYEKGPEHEKEFGVEACLGEGVVGRGKGRSKKIAEQHAAYEALLALQDEEE